MEKELELLTKLVFERKKELLALNDAINSTPDKAKLTVMDEVSRLKAEQYELEKSIASKKFKV